MWALIVDVTGERVILCWLTNLVRSSWIGLRGMGRGGQGPWRCSRLRCRTILHLGCKLKYVTNTLWHNTRFIEYAAFSTKHCTSSDRWLTIIHYIVTESLHRIDRYVSSDQYTYNDRYIVNRLLSSTTDALIILPIVISYHKNNYPQLFMLIYSLLLMIFDTKESESVKFSTPDCITESISVTAISTSSEERPWLSRTGIVSSLLFEMVDDDESFCFFCFLSLLFWALALLILLSISLFLSRLPATIRWILIWRIIFLW